MNAVNSPEFSLLKKRSITMKTVVSHFGSIYAALLALMVKLVLTQEIVKFKINFKK